MSTTGGWAPTAVPAPAVRPGTGRFWLAGALVVAGIVGAVVILVWVAVGYATAIDDFDRIPVPGEEVVEVRDAGGYTLYVEAPGAVDRGIPLVPMEIVPATGGEPLELRRYSARVTYTSGSREGIAVWSVQIPEPGRYRITTGGEPGLTNVAFGRGLGRGLAGRIAAAVLVGGLGVTAGAVLAIVTGVQRSRSRKAMLATGAGWPQAAPPAPWSTPSWPGQHGAPGAPQAAPPPPPPPPPPSSWPPPPA
jgi:hypothetical protein